MASKLERRREEEKVHQFLMGLDDIIYGTVRSNRSQVIHYLLSTKYIQPWCGKNECAPLLDLRRKEVKLWDLQAQAKSERMWGASSNNSEWVLARDKKGVRANATKTSTSKARPLVSRSGQNGTCRLNE
ncbi:unnamed protein product [Dovyalis caffra]|uniref:Uncharacterized protein n=1 Tax=Dovyalis caffra TaxID=77055 RepID=A0AAV1SQ53_9ROSI|nr:unnamed protein product [Dovyalis caffra]